MVWGGPGGPEDVSNGDIESGGGRKVSVQSSMGGRVHLRLRIGGAARRRGVSTLFPPKP